MSAMEDVMLGHAERRLPRGWRWAQLGEVCVAKTGTRDPRHEPDRLFQYVDISGVDNASKTIVAAKTLPGRDAPSRARKIIRTGDVLVSTTRPNLNAVAMVPEELNEEICSTGFCVLRADRDVEPLYLFAFVRSNEFIDSLTHLVRGALYPAVTDSHVYRQWLPLPPGGDQMRIAAILAKQMAALDRARAAVEAQLEAAKALPAAYLREVFEGGEAAGWPRRRLADFAETCSGSTPSRARPGYYAGNIPWVKTGELRDGEITETEEHVSPEAMRGTSLKLLPVGTVLVAMYGQGQTRGRTGRLSLPATTNQACFAILPNEEEFDSFYLQAWFRYSYARLRRETEGRGGNQPNLNGDMLRGQGLPLPQLAVQARIAQRVRERDQEVSRLRITICGQLKPLNRLRDACMRRAFEEAGAK